MLKYTSTEGVKSSILMRKAGEPNMKVDWDAWAKENIFKTSKIVVKAAQVRRREYHAGLITHALKDYSVLCLHCIVLVA